MSSQTAIACLRLVLKPVVDFCLRHGLKIQDINEQTKALFLERAANELARQGNSINPSRLSAMTGIHRKFIPGLVEQSKTGTFGGRNVAAKILGLWRGSKKYTTKDGSARILTLEGVDSQFAKLVKSVSADLNPFTVLSELERLGAVERTDEGVKLQKSFFLARESLESGMGIVGEDLGDLLKSVEENILSENETPPHLHLTTEYDNIPDTYLPIIEKWLIYEGSIFHKRAREYIGQFDRDITPSTGIETGRNRVKITAFSHTASFIHLAKDSSSKE